jgi:hypothetical protein
LPWGCFSLSRSSSASETHAAIDARRYDVAINNLLGIKKLMAT